MPVKAYVKIRLARSLPINVTNWNLCVIRACVCVSLSIVAFTVFPLVVVTAIISFNADMCRTLWEIQSHTLCIDVWTKAADDDEDEVDMVRLHEMRRLNVKSFRNAVMPTDFSFPKLFSDNIFVLRRYFVRRDMK